MQVDDASANPRLAVVGRRSMLVQDVVVEVPGLLAVFLPPLAYAAHVVGGGGANRQVGVGPCVAELGLGILGHTLYLEGQDTQLVHHGGDAGGNHAQVFGAAQHLRSLYQRGQLPHCLAVPEVGVAAVEEVVVQAVEAVFLVVVERAVGVGELCRDARVVFALLVRIFDEEHLVDKAQQTVADAVVLFGLLLVVLGQGGEVFDDLALRVVLRQQSVAAIAQGLEVLVAHLVGELAEEVAEEPVHDVGLGLHLDVEPEVVVVAQLVGGEGQGRVEVAQQAVHGVHRDLPDAEEAQHVVDAVGVEVLRHLAQTVFPPGKAVLAHLVPVVGGEAPVLAQDGEVIGGSAGLAVHVEQACVGPGVDAGARDADGDVALDGHALGVGVVADALHLLVEVVLQIVYKVDVVLVVLDYLRHLFGRVLCVFAPLGKVGRAVFVAQDAEGGVVGQPALVARHKGGEVGRGHHLLALLGEDFAAVGHLALVDALVVYLGQSVELGGKVVVVLHALGVLQRPQLLQTQVHRVQGEGRVGVVGVRVGPGARHRRVVDGEELQEGLTRLRAPVNHLFEVDEVAHAEVALGAHREDGDGRAGTAPGCRGVLEGGAVYHHGVGVGRRVVRHDAVVAVLPCHHRFVGALEDDEFILCAGGNDSQVEGDLPLGEGGVAQQDGLARVPRA